MTTSSGLFGLAKNLAYAAAKGGVVGLTRSLAVAGRKHGIRVNALAPAAMTRMAGPPAEGAEVSMAPELVAPMAAFLAHEDCPVTGEIYAAGAGRFARIFLGSTPGYVDADATVDLVTKHPNVVLLRTFSKCHGLAGLRVGYAICSPQFRGAVDAVRQPFSVNAIAQAAATEAIRHQDDVADRVEKNLIERVFVEESLHQLGFATAESQTNFAWMELGDLDEGEVVTALTRAGVAVRPGTPLGGPGCLRVSYGTRAENERFLAAMGEIAG
jgi:hypothetical protein